MFERLHRLPWLTLQIIAANAAVILALAAAWYLAFIRQSSVYSERLMSTFNIEPGRLHAMYVDDVERQLWASVIIGLLAAILASVGLTFLIVRPLRSLARATERLRHGDYRARSAIERGEVGHLAENFNALAASLWRHQNHAAPETGVAISGAEFHPLHQNVRPLRYLSALLTLHYMTFSHQQMYVTIGRSRAENKS